MRRGLVLLAAGLMIDLASRPLLSITVHWMTREAWSGRRPEGLIDAIRIIGWASMGVTVLVGSLVAFGALVVARAPATRRWGIVAVVAAVGGLGLALAISLLRPELLRSSDKTFFLSLVIGRWALGLLVWLALGLVCRGALVSAGRRVPAWAALVWATAIAGEVAIGLVQFTAPEYTIDEAWQWSVFGFSIAVLLARLLLVLGTRRSLTRAPEAPGPDAWALRVADALSFYRGGLIARLVIAVAGALLAFLLLGRGPTAWRGLVLALPIPDAIAAAAMVIGLFRLGDNLPSARAGAFVGAVFLVGAGAIQLFSTWIAWRVQSFAGRAGAGTGLWDTPEGLQEMVELARAMPAMELVATVLALLGFLLILTSLRWLADWLQQPSLRARAVGLSLGAAFLVLLAAGLRFYLVEARGADVKWIIPLALVAVVGALVLFLLYMKFLADLIAALRGGRAAVPPARVVSDGAV